jgi:hypothetical protein
MKLTAPNANGKFKLPSEGIHTATFTGFEDLGFKPDPFNPGKSKHELKLTFVLEDDSKQFAWVRASLHPEAKLYEIVTALLGANPPAELELESLLDFKCQVEILHYANAKKQARSKIVDYRVSR